MSDCLWCKLSSPPLPPVSLYQNYYLLDLFWGCSDVSGSALRVPWSGTEIAPSPPVGTASAHSPWKQLPGGCQLYQPRLSGSPPSLTRVKPLQPLQNLCGNFIYCRGVFQAENLELEWPFAHSSCWFIRESVRVWSRCWCSWHEAV